jgi:hypothetical protein
MYEGDQQYVYKNAVVREQGSWLLDQESRGLAHDVVLYGTNRTHRWAEAMASLTTGVVIH